MKKLRILPLLVLLLAACGAPAAERSAAEVEAAPTRTPFMMAGDIFTSVPHDFLIPPGELLSNYTASDGSESPNSRLLELRADGAEYIAATGRLDGFQQQYDRSAGDGPLYVINVVNIYETSDGPHTVLSPEWHADVWNRIDSGELTQLPSIAGLDTEHLVWQDASGTIGVEMAYRNLYILITGPTDGADQTAFFSNLAVDYLDWIKAGEPQ
jgi:hypothetical protein